MNMNSNYEFINHPQIKHVKFIVNRIVYCHHHIHSDFEIAMVLKGKGIIETEKNKYLLEEGDLFFVNSYDKHSYSATYIDDNSLSLDGDQEPPIFLIVQISYHFLREYFPLIRNVSFESCLLKEYLPQEYMNLLNKLLISGSIHYFEMEPYFQLSVISTLSFLLKLCLQYVPNKIISDEEKENLKKRNNRIQRIISYIDEHYSSKIKLEDIADKEGITTTHLSHIFSESFGVSFQQYLNLKRLEKSVLLLADKNKKIIDVSYECGFSDPKYMNQLYKKYFNCKPKEFRSRNLVQFKNLIPKEIKQEETVLSDSQSIVEIKNYVSKNKIKVISKDILI